VPDAPVSSFETNIPLTGCAPAKPTDQGNGGQGRGQHKKTTVHMRLIVGKPAVARATSVRL
jgi:hypothetical protein